MENNKPKTDVEILTELIQDYFAQQRQQIKIQDELYAKLSRESAATNKLAYENNKKLEDLLKKIDNLSQVLLRIQENPPEKPVKKETMTKKEASAFLGVHENYFPTIIAMFGVKSCRSDHKLKLYSIKDIVGLKKKAQESGIKLTKVAERSKNKIKEPLRL